MPVFCIVDLHSITTAYEPEALHEATLAGAGMLFATGIDPERSIVFAQSHVPAHAEAAWLLSSAASFGELRRMTQFKDKSEEQEFVSAGLFNYPVLMAGDILLYQTDIVPVGDDQRQHIELARNIAERFNQRYGETFTVPKGVFPEEGARIKNLQEPERLMSTSAGAPQGVVRMIDPPDVIRKKFKTAVTDSGRGVVHDPEAKPGRLQPDRDHVRGDRRVDPRDRGALRRPGVRPFKDDVAEAVVELLAPIQERYRELRADDDGLRRLLALGAEKAAAESAPTLARMYDAHGLRQALSSRSASTSSARQLSPFARRRGRRE